MYRRLFCLILTGILLLSVGSLFGCGKSTNGVEGITLGFLWDFTGRASYATRQVYYGVLDFVSLAKKEGRLSKDQVRIVTYDTQSDASRVPVGYMWLKGQGMNVLSCAPHDGQVIERQFIEDQVPVISVGNMEYWLDSEWYFTTLGPVSGLVESLLNWIMDTWDYDSSRPKVGFVSFAGVPFYQEELDSAMALVNQHPDKFESFKYEMAPTTTTTWTSEIARLKDSDFIIVAVSGPPLTSFIREARSRGYVNRLIGPQDSTIAYWRLVSASVPQTGLDGTIASTYFPFWYAPGDYSSQIREYALANRPGEPEADPNSNTGYLAGWGLGYWLVDIAERATQEEGIQIDGQVLQRIILETDLEVEGWGNRWNFVPGYNSLCRTAMLYEYKAAEAQWVSISDWSQIPSLEK